jgi:hypothetical protein
MGGFDVVITGFKLNGRESAAKVLERVLGEQPDSAKALAKTFPSVVRHALAPAEADAVVLALRAAGARVELRAAGTAAPAAQPAPLAPTASAMAGLIAAQPRPASVPVPAQQGVQLGAARIAEPAREEKKSTGKFILGTLKILLNGPPPPPPQQPAVVIKPAPEPALTADEMLHATGMRDEAFDDVGTQQPLELDTEALQARANYVSGGRKEQKEQPARPSLLDIMADIPLRVVRRAKPQEEVAVEPGALASLESRHPYIWHAFVGVGLLVCLVLSLAIIYKEPARHEVAHAAAKGGPEVLTPEEQKAKQDAKLGPEMEQEAPALHPILQIAPKPMEPALAGILRKQVNGTQAVRIDWGDAGPPQGERVSCMVISGNAMQQRERARTLLATGRRYPMTPLLEKQMRDHMEVMRLADGDPKARYTPLCISN